MSYIVKQEDLIEEIEGFPIEVVQKMIERQVEQGNPADVELFQRDCMAEKFEGGFRWLDTEEGKSFWDEVINEKNFDLFFERYPKQEQAVKTAPVEPQFPCWMYVADEQAKLSQRRKRFVLCKLSGKYIAIAILENEESEEKLLFAMNNIGYCNWLYAIPIPYKTKITRGEIAKKFGIDPDFKIID